MGLLIKQTENKIIKILGTEITLENIYGRLEFAGRADGITLEVALSTYASKEAYKINSNLLSTTVENCNFSVTLQNETQDVTAAHKYARLYFENLGYDVEIVK